MIRADRQPLFEWLFSAYNTRMLRKHFNSLRILGLEQIDALDRSRPIVIFGNHSCWWDGLVEFFLSRNVFRLEPFMMMDEEQMSRYRFFRWIGAFSVNRSVPREAAVSLRYAMSLFKKPGRVLWIYPQGVMRPNDARPLNFAPGLGRIAQELPGAQIMPIAHRYEFVREQRPDGFITLGPVQTLKEIPDAEDLTRELETALTRQVDDLREMIAGERFEPFRTLLQGSASTNRKYDRFRVQERPS
jgi:1-acyl-sn-glycerol-3-phosphate acyltransferase